MASTSASRSTGGVTSRIRTAASTLYSDNQSLIGEIRKALNMMKDVGVDLERDNQFQKVKELENAAVELLATHEQCTHFSSAVLSVGDRYQPGEESTDFKKLFDEETAKLKANSSSVPENNPMIRQFREAVWVARVEKIYSQGQIRSKLHGSGKGHLRKVDQNFLSLDCKREPWKARTISHGCCSLRLCSHFFLQKVHHAGQPMPGEEQDDIVMTSTQCNLLNVTCPLSGKPVTELAEPVRSVECKHIYDEKAITIFLRSNARARCPVAGCPKMLQVGKVVRDPLLLIEIDELRTLSKQSATTSVIEDCTEFDEDELD
uniref:SP-RING-type domain-containing protein n=1 Tax=Fagus sylvatica TaxID=28930 RepID=A0A2N9G4N0_FAGSY